MYTDTQNKRLRVSRRDFLKLAGCSALGGLPWLANNLQAKDHPSGRKLNFVVIMADDMGAAELACYGNTEHKTPNLDKLASEGMRFRTCYSTPLCSPTRVMIMTGRYGFRTGWYNFRSRAGGGPDRPGYKFGKAEKTFADVLKKAGYRTALSGKWQLGGKPPELINDCGFDEYRIWAYTQNLPKGLKHTGAWQTKNTPSRYWHPSILENGNYLPTQTDDYGPDIYTEFLMDFIEHNTNRPFLAYYPMCLPHTPWDPIPLPESGGYGKFRTEKNRNYGHKNAYSIPVFTRPGNLKTNVEYMDYLVGRIVNQLEESNLRENTVIIFTGDNGTHHAGKGIPAEIGVKVPLIVSCPGTVKSGIVSGELVDLTDILPTLADFAECPLPKDSEIDGVSLVPTLKVKDVQHREWIFSYLHERRILRTKNWLLEGDGRFYYCGDSHNFSEYKEMTSSQKPEAVRARKRFEQILKQLPAPENLEKDKKLENRLQKYHEWQKQGQL